MFDPGATIGILGGGQLGRMLALSARRAGYGVHVLTDQPHSPGAQVADHVIVGAYDDPTAFERLARAVDVVTLEFENLGKDALEAAARHAPIRPGVLALSVTQNRGREKEFLARYGFPHAPFVAVTHPSELERAAEGRFPFVAKTAGFGYDGKGQVVASGQHDLALVAELLTHGPLVLEAQVQLAAELSVVGARSATGEVQLFAPFLNTHVGGILDSTTYPGAPHVGSALADLDWPRLAASAAEATAELLRLLEVVGVACVEFFVSTGGALLVNEIAPRPHNSGHVTIEAASVSQFELQWRAVTGMPLAPARCLSPAAMVNLLGEEWRGGEPRWRNALSAPGVSLHLYGKGEARPGRKMGHLTALAATTHEALHAALSARSALTAPGGS